MTRPAPSSHLWLSSCHLLLLPVLESHPLSGYSRAAQRQQPWQQTQQHLQCTTPQPAPPSVTVIASLANATGNDHWERIPQTLSPPLELTDSFGALACGLNCIGVALLPAWWSPETASFAPLAMLLACRLRSRLARSMVYTALRPANIQIPECTRRMVRVLSYCAGMSLDVEAVQHCADQ